MSKLRLSSAVKVLEQRNEYALENKISYLDFLSLLLDDELASRQNNTYLKKLAQSKLNQQKRLDNYDFSCQIELDKKLIMDLGSCRFINQRQNIIFMGKPGVGKTHLANGIGLEALKQDHGVMFVHANSLIEQLHRSKADGKYPALIRKINNVELLIIDEVGFKKFPQNGIDDFFEIIRSRYETGSIIITTNRNFEDWGALFGDAVMASAIIDRLVHHAKIVKITGDSYRIRGLGNNVLSGVDSENNRTKKQF